MARDVRALYQASLARSSFCGKEFLLFLTLVGFFVGRERVAGLRHGEA